ncbi:MAG: AraC family transcriptional regulator [Opitutaceae bacterium]|jgi:AraC family transcriptional regulator|nr:AraC family transcriptional regulator [Opitutaceae bacterium]
MLRYLAKGKRLYDNLHDSHPPGRVRGNWEFFAIMRGRVRPTLPGGPLGPFESDALWVFPPDSPHGWESPARQSCSVIIFHFSSLHPVFENALPSSRYFRIALGPPEKRALARLHNTLLPHYRQPRHISLLRFEAAMLELCYLILEHERELASTIIFNANDEKALQARQWYREHLASGIGIADVARAVHVSTSHLRRIFKEAHGESPRDVLNRIASEEACRLMTTTTMSLKEVAAHCGFNGFNEFRRFFKRVNGHSPFAWRANHIYAGKGIPTRKT